MKEGNIEELNNPPTEEEIDAKLKTLPYKMPFQMIVFKVIFEEKGLNMDDYPDKVVGYSNLIRKYILDHNNIEIRKFLTAWKTEEQRKIAFEEAAQIMIKKIHELEREESLSQAA
jgi:hypothetical protein